MAAHVWVCVRVCVCLCPCGFECSWNSSLKPWNAEALELKSITYPPTTKCHMKCPLAYLRNKAKTKLSIQGIWQFKECANVWKRERFVETCIQWCHEIRKKMFLWKNERKKVTFYIWVYNSCDSQNPKMIPIELTFV